MPMFGMGRFGGGMDEEERRRMAALANSAGMAAQPISMTPGARQTLQNAPRMEEKPKRQSYWQGGDKLTARDAIGAALMAVGDGFSNWSGGGGGNVQNLMRGRMSALEQAQAARAQAQAAIAQQQAKMEERAYDEREYDRRRQVDAQYRPQEPRMISTPDGTTYFGTMDEIRSAMQAGQGGAPARLPGNFFDGPQGRAAPTIQNTPAPQLNAQGNPNTLTRAQYQAIVAARGQAATDDYLRRYGITVSN